VIAAFTPFLSLRYLLTRRINLLGIGGVMFAVWAMIVVDSVFTGFVSEIRRDVRNSTTDLLVSDLPHDTEYAALAAVLAQEPEVVATAPRLRHHGMIQALRSRRNRMPTQSSSQVDFDHTENGFALLLGVDPDREAAVSGVRQWLAHGPEVLADKQVFDIEPSVVWDEPDARRRRHLYLPDEIEWDARRRAGLPRDRELAEFRSSLPGVLLGWRRIRNGFFAPGDPLDVVIVSFQPADDGTAQVQTHDLHAAFAGWFATGHRTFDETTAIVPIEALRTALGHDAADPLSKELVTDIAIRVRDGLAPQQLVDLQRRLQQRVQQELRPGSGPCQVYDWEQQNSVFLSAVAHEQAMMQFVLFVVMLVAAFVIYATLHMMVTQKIKDIGILAALGGAPRQVGGVFLLGGLTIAVIGTALGIGLGVLSTQWMNPINDWLFANWGVELFPRRLFDMRAIPCHLESSWITAVAIGAVVLAVLTAFLPSRKAARMNPVLALSHE
jgi:lipoprotein-releasing system permease protein